MKDSSFMLYVLNTMIRDDLTLVYVVTCECVYTDKVTVDGVYESVEAATNRLSTICKCDEDTYSIVPQSIQTATFTAERKAEIEANRARYAAEKALENS